MPRLARVLLLAAVLAGLLLLPRFVSSYKLLTYTTVLCLALMAQGWNFIGGYTGYAAFGNVAFFGIGAYTTGLLMLSRWHFSFFPALAAGALLSALVATLVGIPVLRLKGHYFAIATLGVAEAFREIASAWDRVTEGATGIDLPVRSDSAFFYYTALSFVVAGIMLTARLARSKLGYGWVAIREDHRVHHGRNGDRVGAAPRRVGLSAPLDLRLEPLPGAPPDGSRPDHHLLHRLPAARPDGALPEARRRRAGRPLRLRRAARQRAREPARLVGRQAAGGRRKTVENG